MKMLLAAFTSSIVTNRFFSWSPSPRFRSFGYLTRSLLVNSNAITRHFIIPVAFACAGKTISHTLRFLLFVSVVVHNKLLHNIAYWNVLFIIVIGNNNANIHLPEQHVFTTLFPRGKKERDRDRDCSTSDMREFVNKHNEWHHIIEVS